MPKIKFNHHKLLTDDLAMIINGKRNVGKTTLLFELLTTPGVLDFNHLMIYSQTINQHIYQFIKYGFENNLKKDIINNLLYEYESSDELVEEDIENMCLVAKKDSENISKEVIAQHDFQAIDQRSSSAITIKLSDNINDFNVNKLDTTKKNLMVFDDCSSNKDQTIQTSFFQNGRHLKCACIYLTHRFHQPELRALRGNTSIFVLFELPKKTLEQIKRDINLGMDSQDFYLIADVAWSVPKEKNYLFINPELEGLRVLVSPF